MLHRDLQINPSTIQLESSWKNRLEFEFEQDYMKSLKLFLTKELKTKAIYPKRKEYFEAFNQTPFEKVKVVLIGQDPYHAPSQAHGLSFSVQKNVQIPPSLRNIYKELQSDLSIPMASHGFLLKWAKQGVLLLNSTLSVEARRPASHKGRGWEQFTNKVCSLLNEERKNLVFFLWGSYAQEKGKIIDTKKHCVLKAPHPSPFSADRGFFGCRHFSKANDYLESTNQTPIDWSSHLR